MLTKILSKRPDPATVPCKVALVDTDMLVDLAFGEQEFDDMRRIMVAEDFDAARNNVEET